MSDERKSKTISVPGVLVESCEQYLEGYGFNSLSELVRDLLRDWSNAKKQEQRDEMTGRQFLEAREEEKKMQMNAFRNFKELLEEGRTEEAEELVTYLLEGGKNEEGEES